MANYPPAPPAGTAPGAPPAQGPKLSVSWTGFLLALGGLVAAIGAFLPYEKIADTAGNSYKFTGIGSESTTGDVSADFFTPGNAGKIILVAGIVALVLGILVATRKGRLWVGIVGIVAGAIGLILSLAALGAPSSDAKDLVKKGATGVEGSVQIGAVLGAVGTGLALLGGILAVAIRRRNV